MRPAFHPDASFFGNAGEQLAVGTPFLFDWIDKNGPAPNIQPRFVSVDILESIAVVRLEVDGWSGLQAGSGVSKIRFLRTRKIERWSQWRTRKLLGPSPEDSGSGASPELGIRPAVSAPPNGYLAEHDGITRAIDCYLAGSRTGDRELMRAAFHPEATIAGYCFGVEYSGSIEHLFRWISENGPAPNIEPRFARIEILETIAVVHLEVQGWSGKPAGINARITEVFTQLKRDGQWQITQKTFHWQPA